MPIFEYKCRSCGHCFEKLVRHGVTPDCPACNAADPEQLLSLPGISTQKTRSHSIGVARKTASGIKRDKDHAQREYETNYIKDHS